MQHKFLPSHLIGMENLFFHLPKTRSESPPKVGFWRSGKKALYYLRNSKTMFALISPTENNACKQKYKDNCFQIIDLSFRYPLGILLTQKKDLFITTHTHKRIPWRLANMGFCLMIMIDQCGPCITTMCSGWSDVVLLWSIFIFQLSLRLCVCGDITCLCPWLN